MTSLILTFAVLAQALTGHAAALYTKAQQQGVFRNDAKKLSLEIRPTSDGQSFVAIWKPKKEPMRWIVTLHGTEGFATDVLSRWERVAQPENVGIVSVQWWLGDSPTSYYAPSQVYNEVSRVLESLHVQPGTVMFHGYSRGAANSYAVVALDAARGRKYFSLAVADSGGVALEFPPTRAIVDGTLGTRPLQGTRWITSAGAKDPHADRDGIAGMRKTVQWLKEQGATVVLSIEDPNQGHGALQRNIDNSKKVLKIFMHP